MKEAVFTLKLEADLRDAFMQEAESLHRPASQLVREFMRDFVKQQQERRNYETWLDADLDRAVREADNPDTRWLAQSDLEQGRWRAQRDALAARIAARDAGKE